MMRDNVTSFEIADLFDEDPETVFEGMTNYLRINEYSYGDEGLVPGLELCESPEHGKYYTFWKQPEEDHPIRNLLAGSLISWGGSLSFGVLGSIKCPFEAFEYMSQTYGKVRSRDMFSILRNKIPDKEE